MRFSSSAISYYFLSVTLITLSPSTTTCTNVMMVKGDSSVSDSILGIQGLTGIVDDGVTRTRRNLVHQEGVDSDDRETVEVFNDDPPRSSRNRRNLHDDPTTIPGEISALDPLRRRTTTTRNRNLGACIVTNGDGLPQCFEATTHEECSEFYYDEGGSGKSSYWKGIGSSCPDTRHLFHSDDENPTTTTATTTTTTIPEDSDVVEDGISRKRNLIHHGDDDPTTTTTTIPGGQTVFNEPPPLSRKTRNLRGGGGGHEQRRQLAVGACTIHNEDDQVLECAQTTQLECDEKMSYGSYSWMGSGTKCPLPTRRNLDDGQQQLVGACYDVYNDQVLECSQITEEECDEKKEYGHYTCHSGPRSKCSIIQKYFSQLSSDNTGQR